MRRTVVIAATALALGLIGCDRPGGSEDAEIQWRVVSVKPDPPGSPQTLRPLTEKQRRQAARIIAGDTRFRRIVAGHRYRLSRTIPLGTQDNRGPQPREVLIGARSDVVLNNPRRSVTTTWPLMDFDLPAMESGDSPAYRVTTARLTVKGLRSMAAFVDLKRQSLAGLSPEQTDEVVWPPGWPTVRAPSGR